MQLRSALSRALRLRCPRCGDGQLFRSWFRMHPRCAACGLDFHREPGFYLGSIYVNYGLTAILVTAAYLLLAFVWELHEPSVRLGTLAFAVFFPLWFFRYARAIWLAFDETVDPQGRADVPGRR